MSDLDVVTTNNQLPPIPCPPFLFKTGSCFVALGGLELRMSPRWPARPLNPEVPRLQLCTSGFNLVIKHSPGLQCARRPPLQLQRDQLQGSPTSPTMPSQGFAFPSGLEHDPGSTPSLRPSNLLKPPTPTPSGPILSACSHGYIFLEWAWPHTHALSASFLRLGLKTKCVSFICVFYGPGNSGRASVALPPPFPCQSQAPPPLCFV